MRRLFCILLFLPLALAVSVRPVYSAVPSYYAAREHIPDNVCVCPPGLIPAQLRATQPSRLAYNTYDSNSNRMANAGGSAITYTSAGNISAIGSDTFAYNKANQMATATVSGTASTYVYDTFGQRLKSTVGAGTPVIQQYGMGGLLLSETQGAAETNYVYLNGLPIAAINTASPAISYIHTNHLGTPQMATNSGQSVVWSGAYQPFGAVTPTTSITQNLRFPGQYADPTGLSYNMFRTYNPTLGRYMESDPIGLAGGINPYVYANSNPFRFIDPLGLQAHVSFLTSDNGNPPDVVEATKNYKPDDYNSIAAHGTATGNFTAAPSGPALDVSGMASSLKSDPNYIPELPTKLLACKAAATGGAQALADALGSPVLASREDVYPNTKPGGEPFGPDGEFYIASSTRNSKRNHLQLIKTEKYGRGTQGLLF